jgi:thioredoxin:protein disulfide reductase
MSLTRLRSIASVASLVLLSLAPLDGRQLGPDRLPVNPLTERPTARPGQIVRLALQVPITPGLHVQSNKPRDRSLIPATITFQDVPGITVTEIVFPASVDIPLPGFDEPAAVFEGELLIGITAQLAPSVKPGPLIVPGRFRYQACNDTSCFAPVTVPVSWTIEVAADGGRGASPHVEAFRSIAFGTGEPPAPPTPRESTPAAVVATTGSPLSVEQLVALFDEFEVRGTDVGYRSTEEFLRFIDNAEKGVKPEGLFANRGPLAILAIVFIGGLALNLTPCVLPMIPINLMIIGAGARSGQRGRGFVLGSSYGAAMAAVYGILGLVVILTAGTFGTINASPWFNLGIAVLFVVLGLAMFDVISIDFSRYSSKIRFNQESRGSVPLAFGMGSVAALLAGACVAPVVIQVVVFASDMYAKGSAAALALPFVLGLGMALPWPLAGAGFSALPKPGAWMVRVKQAMGVFILASAVYYGYLAYGIFASRWVDPATVSASVDEMLESGWHASLSEGLETAKRENKPVLIDFWATWCKNCLTMDKTTLASEPVERALDGYVKIKFQAEDLYSSPTKELMQRVGGRGLPTYSILKLR